MKEAIGSGIYDVIVIGAGHAGCEAALAAARLGKKTLLLTISLEQIAHMPCNPSIGGTGKGQLVKEIDALGGEMGVMIDKCFIQSRMLNRSKGPAVWSPRAQADKELYHVEMKKTLERQERLHLRQGEVERLQIENKGGRRRAKGVLLRSGTEYKAPAVILATGTYLGSRVFVSDRSVESGPSGFASAAMLSKTMLEDGFVFRRFKTGTPARVLAWSLDYEKMTEQKGDDHPVPFSYINDEVRNSKVSCWLTYTNPEAHKLVADNIELTAPYGGHTTGVGPRYCLSIEDKVSRFPTRERHQLFLEPEGTDTEEVYIQGMSTSLPEALQEEFYKMIPGLEQAMFSRYAYSIEYDCLDPLLLTPALAYSDVEGLFCAGQINGTSGYEEAAAQGLMAGINAARMTDGKTPFILERSEAYIGVLIDDLITKGTEEPYRIMTSRAEFRLVLRQDNADLRLTPKGYEIGLASKERLERCKEKQQAAEKEIARLRETKVTAEAANELLAALGSSPVSGSVSLAELLVRPEVDYEALSAVDLARSRAIPGDFSCEGEDVRVPTGPPCSPAARAPRNKRESSVRAARAVRDLALARAAREQAEIEIKYAGYIEKQRLEIERFEKLESKRLPDGIDYAALDGLRLEARQKLARIQPVSLGQAARISGVSPADISVLMIYLKQKEY